MMQRYSVLFYYKTARVLGLIALACVLLLLSAAPVAAQVTGISYTLSPIGARIQWDDDAGLDDGYFYGGQLGLGFGQYVEVSGLYMLGNGFETDFSGFSGDDPAVLQALEDLASREVDITRYGAKLRVNVGSGSVTPFVTAGTGIIKFDPADLMESENIYATGGAGITFSLASRYTLSVGGEVLAYRYNPGNTFFSDADLAQVGIGRESFNQQTVYNPSLSASVKFYLGGRSEDDMTEVDRALLRQFQGGGFRLAVEPFYGQIDFNDDLVGFPENQTMAGVNAGFDLGPYIGLRGFYWRALEQDKALDDFTTDFTDLAMYGGELDLRFKSSFGGGITPYVALGGGYLNAGESYEEFSGLRPEDRYFALGGGGIELPLSSALLLQAGVRGLFMSNQNVEDLSDPNSVFTSLMYTAGVNFNLGGSGRTAGDVVGRELADARADAETRDAAMEQQLASIQARLDSLEMAQPMRMEQRMVRDSTGALVAEPTMVMRRDTMIVRETKASNLSGQTITIPVPEEGEIYIRFGNPDSAPVEQAYAPPTVVVAGGGTGQPMMQQPMMRADSAYAGGLTAGQIRQIVRQAVAEQQGTQDGMSAEEMESSLRAMEERLERRIARESTRLRDDLNSMEQPREVRTVDEDGRTIREEEMSDGASSGLFGGFSNRELIAIMPTIGARFGDGSNQFLVGARADYRLPGRRLRFVPEAEIGFGDNTSLVVIANAVLPINVFNAPVEPYVGVGVGLDTSDGLGLNLLGGAQYTLSNGLRIFGEYSTLDFFNVNRVLGGVRVQF